MMFVLSFLFRCLIRYDLTADLKIKIKKSICANYLWDVPSKIFDVPEIVYRT